MNETVDNRIAYQPSPDALAEISVETNNYAADVGNVAGGVISNVIKSGTNQLRGNAFEFYRNSDIDANTWANNRSGATKAERTQHIFGATLGGPIIKNKLFFFVDYQGTVLDQPGAHDGLGRPGGVAHRGPLEPPPGHDHPDPLTGQPFPNNQIPLEPDQPDRSRDPEQPGLPASEPRRSPASPATTCATTSARPAPTRATCASTGTRRPTTSSSSASRSRSSRQSNDKTAFPLLPRAADRLAVPQPGGQLEPRLQPVADQRGARRLQLDQHRHLARTTGAASATPTRPSGSPAGSRSPASARSTWAAA